MQRAIRVASMVAPLAAAPMAKTAILVCTEASPSALNPQLSTAGTVFDVGAQRSSAGSG